MRYKPSAEYLWAVCVKEAEGVAKQISENRFFGSREDAVYHAYPRYLVHCLNMQKLEDLYFPWENADGFEPLHVHLANSRNQPLINFRGMGIEDLLVALRPDIRRMRLSQDQIDAVLSSGGVPEEVKADLELKADLPY